MGMLPQQPDTRVPMRIVTPPVVKGTSRLADAHVRRRRGGLGTFRHMIYNRPEDLFQGHIHWERI